MKRWFIHKNSFSSDSSSIYAPSNLANCSSVNSTMFSTKQPRKIRASLNILPCMDKWELLLWEMSWKMRIMQGHKKKKKSNLLNVTSKNHSIQNTTASKNNWLRNCHQQQYFSKWFQHIQQKENWSVWAQNTGNMSHTRNWKRQLE